MSIDPARTMPLAMPATSSTSASTGAPARCASSASVASGSAARMIRWSRARRISQRVDGLVERRAGAHDRRRLVAVEAVVAAEVDPVALDAVELADDLLLIVREPLRERLERLRQFGVAVLLGELLRPVAGEEVVAAAVVELADLARRRLAVLQQRAGGGVERATEDPRARVVVLVGQHLERDRERQELAERVPSQVVLLEQLLDVLGRRAARARLEQPAAVHQR